MKENSDRANRNRNDVSTLDYAAFLCFLKTINCLSYLESLSGDVVAAVFNNGNK